MKRTRSTQRIVESFEGFSKLNESTRSRIGLLQDDGTVDSIYIHFDGYFDGVGKDIQNLKTKDQVEDRLEYGDASTVNGGFYKDRGDDADSILSNSINDYIEDTLDCNGEYAYIFDPKTNKWYGKDLYDDKNSNIWTDVSTGEKRTF